VCATNARNPNAKHRTRLLGFTQTLLAEPRTQGNVSYALGYFYFVHANGCSAMFAEDYLRLRFLIGRAYLDAEYHTVYRYDPVRVAVPPENICDGQGRDAAAAAAAKERGQRYEDWTSTGVDHIPAGGNGAGAARKRGRERQCSADILAIDQSSPRRRRDVGQIVCGNIDAAQARPYFVPALDEAEIGAIEAVGKEPLDGPIKVGAQMENGSDLANPPLFEDVVALIIHRRASIHRLGCLILNHGRSPELFAWRLLERAPVK
jgi:hypothetical protein